MGIMEARLDKIEEKLDKVAEALTVLARIEERVRIHMDGEDRTSKRIDSIESRLAEIEKQVISNTWVAGTGERLFWLLMTVVIGAAGYFGR